MTKDEAKALVEKTVEVPKEKDAYKVAQEKYKKQMKIRIK